MFQLNDCPHLVLPVALLCQRYDVAEIGFCRLLAATNVNDIYVMYPAELLANWREIRRRQ